MSKSPSSDWDWFSPNQFDRLAFRSARELNADLLLSPVGSSEPSVSLIACDPREEFTVTPETTREQLAEFCFRDSEPTIGVLSYDFGLAVRGMPFTKQTDFPLGVFRKYQARLERDDCARTITVHGDSSVLVELAQLLDQSDLVLSDSAKPASFHSSLTAGDYRALIEDVIEQIREGYTYQLNLTNRYSAPFDSGYSVDLFAELWRQYPAKFYSLIRAGDTTLLSTSPERFLRVDDGRVLSQPIKGTLAVGHDYDESVRQLTESSKESAELSMIVDLIRNDISYNCEYGSVEVRNHKSVFDVDGLLQMFSDVTGQLRSDRNVIDLLWDAFPCGSVTGCPKQKTMELIDRFEPHSRGPYCGTTVLIRGPRDLESSVNIRAGYTNGSTGELHFFAGSGIVVDSNPEREYLETVAKARKFFELLGLQTPD